MKVDFTVPEQRAREIKLGQHVRFGMTESNLPFKGHVIGMDPRVDPQDPPRLRSGHHRGQQGRGDPSGPVPPCGGDPAGAAERHHRAADGGDRQPLRRLRLYDRAGSSGRASAVQVVKQVFVKTGRRRGGALEILSGVKPGQQVVASGQNKLQAGATVKIDNTIDVTKLDTSKLASGQ